jgi:hypothetical protein
MAAELHQAQEVHVMLRGCSVERLCEAINMARWWSSQPEICALEDDSISISHLVLKRDVEWTTPHLPSLMETFYQSPQEEFQSPDFKQYPSASTPSTQSRDIRLINHAANHIVGAARDASAAAWRGLQPYQPPWPTTGGSARPPFGASAGPNILSAAAPIADSTYLLSSHLACAVPSTAATAALGGVRADLARGQEAEWTVQDLLERIERLEAQVRLHVCIAGCN